MEAVFHRGNEVKSVLAALGKVLVAFALLLECSWHYLFALGAILGDLGAVLGGLRPILGDLGALLGDLGAIQNR